MASVEPVRSFRVQSLQVRVYPDGKSLGRAAAETVAATLRKAIEASGRAVGIFATGASQFDFLAALREQKGIDWRKVTAFQLDEYVGLGPDHPAGLRRYLRERLFDAVRPGTVHYLEGQASDPLAECRRYARLLEQAGMADVACVGIGENGHIAFNDPHVADFDDPATVKVVDLDEPCRKQQYGEGWFTSLEAVPKFGLTQTIPAIMSAKAISCVAPEARKAIAVRNAIEGPIEPRCPASVLRRHGNCIVYLDRESALLLAAR